MSYERNNTMVACILAFILVGGVAVGAVFFLSSSNWNFSSPNINNWNEGVIFEFEQTESSMPTTVTLDMDLSTGGIQVLFVEDVNLLYNISMWVPNTTLTEHGDPVVSYASDKITVNYPTGYVNVTLGTGTTYILDITAATGAVDIILANNASIGNIDVNITTGAISLVVVDDIRVSGVLTFDLDTTTGAITAVVDLPASIGGSFIGSTTTGAVDVTAVGWNEISEYQYETSGFSSATNRISILANTSTGAVDATLT